jgi:hypothetical protein
MHICLKCHQKKFSVWCRWRPNTPTSSSKNKKQGASTGVELKISLTAEAAHPNDTGNHSQWTACNYPEWLARILPACILPACTPYLACMCVSCLHATNCNIQYAHAPEVCTPCPYKYNNTLYCHSPSRFAVVAITGPLLSLLLGGPFHDGLLVCRYSR